MSQVVVEEEYEEEPFGDYILEKELGQGAEGKVYQARKKKEPEEKVALKISHQTVKITKSQFAQETAPLVEASEKLNHPSIIKIQDVGIFKQRPFQELELFTGQNLEEVLEGYQKIQFGSQSQYMPTERAIDIIVKVAQTLSYAHKKGIPHGDIKPANILVDPNDQIKIIDFGLEKIVSEKLRNSLSVFDKEVLGSLGYMAPERQKGEPATSQSDTFSLGAVFYQMLTNQLPTDNNFQTDPSEINPELPTRIDQIYRKMIAANPQDRYYSTRDTIRDLKEAQEILKAPKQKSSLVLKLKDFTNNLEEYFLGPNGVHQNMLNLYKEIMGLGQLGITFETFCHNYTGYHEPLGKIFVDFDNPNLNISFRSNNLRNNPNAYLEISFGKRNIYDKPESFLTKLGWTKRNLISQEDFFYYTLMGEYHFGTQNVETQGSPQQFFKGLLKVYYKNNKRALGALKDLYNLPHLIRDYFEKSDKTAKELTDKKS